MFESILDNIYQNVLQSSNYNSHNKSICEQPDDIIMNPFKCSHKVQDTSQLKRVLETYMNDYNLVHKRGLSLVLSDYLVQHVSRICRAVKHPSGHLLLLGVTGSGRRSAVTLAAFVAGADLFQVMLGSGSLPGNSGLDSFQVKLGIINFPGELRNWNTAR